MLAINNQQRYFLFRDVVDMRKGIDGLSGLVRDQLKLNPLSSDVYLFLNRKRNQVKLLMWDKDGFALYYKRLEQGTYVREKYVNAETGKIIIGELPSRAIDKGVFGENLIAQIITDKYVDHLPLYRQIERFKRSGMTLSASTLRYGKKHLQAAHALISMFKTGSFKR